MHVITNLFCKHCNKWVVFGTLPMKELVEEQQKIEVKLNPSILDEPPHSKLFILYYKKALERNRLIDGGQKKSGKCSVCGNVLIHLEREG